jgi:prepilin-type N-terminal cleavage/methylation domain-containing protein
MRRPDHRNPGHGFSLTEVLVVLAVLGVLLGVALPVTRSVLAKSREASCLGQLRALGVGLEGYLQDHQQTMPVLEAGRKSKNEDIPVLETALLPYLESPETFRCPQDVREFERSGSSYLWNSTQNGLHVSKLAFFGISDRPDKIPLITDKEAWHPSGTQFLYADQSSSNRVRFSSGN